MDSPWWTDEPIPAGATQLAAEPAKVTPWRNPADQPAKPRPAPAQLPTTPAVQRHQPTIVTRLLPVGFLCLFVAVMVVYLAWPR
ncbi:MAG TPA: hypothetical protein VF137_10200 [Candidatus Dormibacteraeota bacterium]